MSGLPQERGTPAGGQGWMELLGVTLSATRRIDVDLPLQTFTILTGPTDAGRHELAFRTLHAEGQRRYLQSLTVAQRRLFDQLERPEADRISRVPPTIALTDVAAETGSTLCELSGLTGPACELWARCAELSCPNCGTPLPRWTTATLLAAFRTLPAKVRVLIAAPVSALTWAPETGPARWIARGFAKALVDSQLLDLQELVTPGETGSDPTAPASPRKSTAGGVASRVSIVIDRLITPSPEGWLAQQGRWNEALELAFREGDGQCQIFLEAERAAAPAHDANSAHSQQESPWPAVWSAAVARRLKVGTSPADWWQVTAARTPFCDVCQFAWPALTAARFEEVTERAQTAETGDTAEIGGVVEQSETTAVRYRESLDLSTLNGQAFRQFRAGTIESVAQHWGHSLRVELPLAGALQNVLHERLRWLTRFGLGRLRLDHPVARLSRSAVRRIQLADVIARGLVGTLILIDEPLAGIPPQERSAVLEGLWHLIEQGNTVIAVDQADHYPTQLHPQDTTSSVVELGTSRVAESTEAEGTANSAGQVTRQTLAVVRLSEWHEKQPIPPQPTKSNVTAETAGSTANKGTGAVAHCNVIVPNEPARWSGLLERPLELVLGGITVVTGPTGSGKSVLLEQVCRAVEQAQIEFSPPTGNPSPRGRAKALAAPTVPTNSLLLTRSNQPHGSRQLLVQRLGVWDDVRNLFAASAVSQQRGWTAGMFSFHSAGGGRCLRCRGRGELDIRFELLPRSRVVCPACGGRRYRKEVLEARLRGLSIAEVLSQPIDAVGELFRAQQRVQGALLWIRRCGLGFLTLGTVLSEIPAGVWQRLHVAQLGWKPLSGPTLVACDEPLGGLPAVDVQAVFASYRELCAIGHTLLIADAHPLAAQLADHVVQVG